MSDIRKRYFDQLDAFIASVASGTATQGDQEVLGMMAILYQISLVENGQRIAEEHQRLAAKHFERQTTALERMADALGRMA